MKENKINNQETMKRNSSTGKAKSYKTAQDIASGMGEFAPKWNTELVCDSTFLRRPSSLAVAGILEHFDACQVNPIRVSERDGKLHVIDGVKTLTALEELHRKKGIQKFPVMCRIYRGMKLEDEARLYAMIDDLHGRLPTAFKIRALLIAKDPEIMDFIKATKESGFDIKPGDYKSRNGFMCATVTAFYCYRKLGRKEYLRMLKILMRTWAGASWSVTKNMLKGMTMFMTEHKVNMNTFAGIFENVSYGDIYKRAEIYRGHHRAGAFAEAIEDFYYGRASHEEDGNQEDMRQAV